MSLLNQSQVKEPQESKSRPRREKEIISRWAAGAGFLAALLAVLIVILDAIKPRSEAWLSSVYAFLERLEKIIPHYLFFLVLFALLAMIYYFLTNMAYRLSRIEIKEKGDVECPEPEGSAGLENGSGTSTTPTDDVADLDPGSLIKRLSQRNDLDVILKDLVSNLDETNLRSLIEEQIAQKPELVTLELLNKIMQSVKRRNENRNGG